MLVFIEVLQIHLLVFNNHLDNCFINLFFTLVAWISAFFDLYLEGTNLGLTVNLAEAHEDVIDTLEKNYTEGNHHVKETQELHCDVAVECYVKFVVFNLKC